MGAVLVCAGLAFTAIVVFLAVIATAVAFLLKAILRLVLLPLLLIKWFVLAIVGFVLALTFGILLMVPLLPFAAVGLLVWAIVRANRRPAVA